MALLLEEAQEQAAQLVSAGNVHGNLLHLPKIKCTLRSQGRKDAVRGTTLIGHEKMTHS